MSYARIDRPAEINAIRAFRLRVFLLRSRDASCSPIVKQIQESAPKSRRFFGHVDHRTLSVLS